MDRFFVYSHDMVVLVEFVLPLFFLYDCLFSNASCSLSQDTLQVPYDSTYMKMLLLCVEISDNERPRIPNRECEDTASGRRNIGRPKNRRTDQ